MRNPPILISIIGFFAILAGCSYLFFGLRVLGFDWFGALGDLPAFNSVGIWGWLAIIAGIAWIAVAFGLWTLQSWARVVTMVIAGFSLFEAVLAFFQFPGSGVGLAMSLLPLVILLYLNSGEVKAAFGEDDSSRGV
jgi:cytochrome c oxidase subunit IV